MLDQTIRKLGRSLDEALKRANQLLSQAEDLEIERAIRTLQVIKGKTYAKALLKENGKILNEISFDIGISLMLRKHRITKAELEVWYDEAERKKFEGHIFQPLPDKADAWVLFQNIRSKLAPLSFAAQDLFEMRKKALLPATPEKITRSAAKTALELGMWPLLNPEQKQEIFQQLEWHELPKQLKLEFFVSLPLKAKERIFELPDIHARENATCVEYNRLKSIREPQRTSEHNSPDVPQPQPPYDPKKIQG
jgi:hypothetical protein